MIDRAGAPVSAGSLQRLTDLEYQWDDRKAEIRAIGNSELAAINDWAQTNGVMHVAQPGEL